MSLRSTTFTVLLLVLTGCRTPSPGEPPSGAATKQTVTPTAADARAAASRGGYVRVHVINVRQGDGIAVTCPDGEVGAIIDSADSRDSVGSAHFEEYITNLIEKDRDKKIPLVVATHPHSDHIGRLKWVLETFIAEIYVDNGQDASTAGFRALQAAVTASHEGKGTSIIRVTSTPDFPWEICPGVKVRAITPADGLSGCKSHPNDCSLMLRLDHGSTSFLFAGDAEKKQEEKLLRDPEVRALLDVDVLKAGHHGSDTSSTQAFLDAVTPRCVLVSAGVEGVGTNSGYKHPRASTMKRFNMAVKAAVPNMGWRTKKARAYDADTGQWVDLRTRMGVAVTTMDGDVVARSVGRAVTCCEGSPIHTTK
jgi:competence protein ComEC